MCDKPPSTSTIHTRRSATNSLRRRTASVSARATTLSTCAASRPRVIDGHRATLAANWVSTTANTSGSVIKSVRNTMV